MELRRSEEFKDIAAALCEAQGEFDVARRDSLNTHLKSSYADITSIKKASQPALTKHKLAVIQTHKLVESELRDPRYVLVTTLIHAPSGQWMEMEYPLHILKQDAQGFAAATTYARRVSWGTILGIVAEEEDDDGHTNTEVERNALGQPIGPAAREEADIEARAMNWAKSQIEKVRKMTTVQIEEWREKNAKTLERLKEQNRDWSDRLVTAVSERMLGLQPLMIDSGKSEVGAPIDEDAEAAKTAAKFQRVLDDLGACNTESEVTDLDEAVTQWITDNDLDFLEKWSIAVSTKRRGLQKAKTQQNKGPTRL
jgi:hypothetical protein